MRLCIYGAGAIGGYLAAELALSGAEVSVVARGATLAALREKGLTLKIDGQTRIVPVRAVEDPADAGPQDAVFVTVKAPAAAAIAGRMAPLLGPETVVVTAQNGLPWWYFYGLEGPYRDHRIRAVDPDDVQWQAIGPERAIGCVVYPAAEVVAPGIVEHRYGNRFMLGEPDGTRSARVERLSEALTKAGLKAPVRPRIRDDIWVKLWGNLSFNPVSALTGGTLAEIAGDPGTRQVIAHMMAEAEAVGLALGVRFGVDIPTRIGWAADVGDHKTSMLQDLEHGRAMEIDALLGAVVELGDLAGIDTPFLDAILALVIQRARKSGGYPG